MEFLSQKLTSLYLVIGIAVLLICLLLALYFLKMDNANLQVEIKRLSENAATLHRDIAVLRADINQNARVGDSRLIEVVSDTASASTADIQQTSQRQFTTNLENKAAPNAVTQVLPEQNAAASGFAHEQFMAQLQTGTTDIQSVLISKEYDQLPMDSKKRLLEEITKSINRGEINSPNSFGVDSK